MDDADGAVSGTAIFSFAGSNIFVVGGTSGIGLGIAEGFYRAGANLAVASRSQDKVDSAVGLFDGIEGADGKVRGYAFDVRDYEAVSDAAERFSQELGAIDVLVSGAAGNFPSAAADLSPNGFKSVVDIDLLGTFHAMRAFYPHFRKPGASVINISAPQAFIAMPLQIHVCAAKAGVDMVTRTLAIEWGPEGIRVNSVVPGPIEGTEGMDRLAPTPEIQQGFRRAVPLGRMGTVGDIASACLFLASDAASYLSGAVIPVDGAWSTAGAPYPTAS